MGELQKLDLRWALVAVVAVEDHEERLRRIVEIESRVSELSESLRDLKAATVRALRRGDPPMTWARIGDLLGTSAQRAEAISRQQ